jgi:hypothetical protein
VPLQSPGKKEKRTAGLTHDRARSRYPRPLGDANTRAHSISNLHVLIWIDTTVLHLRRLLDQSNMTTPGSSRAPAASPTLPLLTLTIIVSTVLLGCLSPGASAAAAKDALKKATDPSDSAGGGRATDAPAAAAAAAAATTSPDVLPKSKIAVAGACMRGKFDQIARKLEKRLVSWFQPLNRNVISWFITLLFQIQLVPLHRGVA